MNLFFQKWERFTHLLMSLDLRHTQKKKSFLYYPVLSFFSYIYLLFYWLRIFIYKYGLKGKKRLKVKVISVGNLTLGGSGKTPMVLYLASEFKKRGKEVVILIRGYKRKEKRQKELYGNPEDLRWELFGDEPYLLSLNLPEVPVIINKRRFEAGVFAQKKYRPDLFILDDGFQHWRLERDIDLVMVDTTSPLSDERLFPLGRLREPLSSLKRADIVVLNKIDQSYNIKDTLNILNRYNPSCFVAQSFYEVSEVENLEQATLVELSSLKGKKTVAFSGIANHLSFEKTLKSLGIVILNHIKFSDHHFYSTKDIMDIQKEGKRCGADFVCTTEKDKIKIPTNVSFQLPTYVVKIRLKIKDQERWFWDFIQEKLRWQ